jgi:hypothetical protein
LEAELIEKGFEVRRQVPISIKYKNLEFDENFSRRSHRGKQGTRGAKSVRDESPGLLPPARQLSEAFFDAVWAPDEFRIRASAGWN